MKKKIYISGPISGRDLQDRRRTFAAVAEDIYRMGDIPVNPLDNGIPESFPWAEHMRRDLQMLLKCSAVCMLPGWKRSRGARLEHHVAEELGMDIFDYEKLQKK